MSGENITKEEAYASIRVKPGYHFLFMDKECLIDDTPALMVYEYIVGGWRRSLYSRLQLSEVLKHPNWLQRLPVKYWHGSQCDSKDILRMIRESYKEYLNDESRRKKSYD